VFVCIAELEDYSQLRRTASDRSGPALTPPTVLVTTIVIFSLDQDPYFSD